MKISGAILLLAAMAAFEIGCASIGPPQAPSLELPKPPSDLKALRKDDQVTLTWTVPSLTTERQSIRYLGKTEVCRSLEGGLKGCAKAVGEVISRSIPDAKSTGKKVTGHFVDTLSTEVETKNPFGFSTYAVEVLNEAGRSAGLSNQIRVPLVPTVHPFGGFTAQAQASGILISWQCPSGPSVIDQVRYLFRIYRRLESGRLESGSVQTKIADVPADICARAKMQGESVANSFLDQTFEWERTYLYRATVVSVIATRGQAAIEVEGSDTPEVRIFAHDVFPPAVPSGLQAVFSGPGQAPFNDLVWTPVSAADLDGYNVYRHEAGAQPTKLNADLVKTPAYRDTNVAAGKSYYYSVSAVDERSNESARSDETHETVP